MNAISPWVYLGIPNLIRPYALKYYIPDVSTIDGIVKCAAQAFEVEPEQIYSKNRRAKVSLARHAAIKIIRDRLKVTFVEISKHLGDRHHATILHSYKQANDLEAAYPPFKAKYAKALKLVEENITIIYRDTIYRDLGDIIQD